MIDKKNSIKKKIRKKTNNKSKEYGLKLIQK